MLIGKVKRGAYLINTALERYATGMPSSLRWKAASWQVTQAMCGSRSRLRRTIPGAPCRIMA